MGKKDTMQKEYMSVPKYFADAFNYYLFNGKQFIIADNLTEKDPTELEIRFSEKSKEIVQKVRDVLKQCVIKVNLLLPSEITDFSKFATDFGKAMKYISISNDKEAYRKIAEQDEYRIINIETARLLNECVGMEIPIEEGVEKMEVCKAVRELKEEAEIEGRLEDIRIMITTLQELGQTNEFIIKIIMDKFEMSESEVQEYV